MRKILLTSAAISALALSGPAIAANPDAITTAPGGSFSAELEAPTSAADGGIWLAETEDPLEDSEEDGDETDAPEDEVDMLAETDGEDEEDDAEDDEYDLLAQDDEADEDEEDEEDDDLPDAG